MRIFICKAHMLLYVHVCTVHVHFCKYMHANHACKRFDKKRRENKIQKTLRVMISTNKTACLLLPSPTQFQPLASRTSWNKINSNKIEGKEVTSEALGGGLIFPFLGKITTKKIVSFLTRHTHTHTHATLCIIKKVSPNRHIYTHKTTTIATPFQPPPPPTHIQGNQNKTSPPPPKSAAGPKDIYEGWDITTKGQRYDIQVEKE